MNEQEHPTTTPLAIFNFAHTYAQSAVALSKTDRNVTHGKSPVSFLYFHAIELYLKAFLFSKGVPIEELEKKYKHNLRKLANKARDFGIVFTEGNELAIMMANKNMMGSRYIRLGPAQDLPPAAYFDVCETLHLQTMKYAYVHVPPGRRPELVE